MINRRQFFGRFLKQKPKQTPPADRNARYDKREVYVRTHLIPDDLELSGQQESQLFTQVRDALKRTSNEELTRHDVFSIKCPVFAQLRSWC